MRSSYGKIEATPAPTPTPPEGCSLTRTLLYVTVGAWVGLPLVYLILFAVHTPTPQGHAPIITPLPMPSPRGPLHSAPASPISNLPSVSPASSLKSCHELRQQHGGGWEPVGGGAVCSEIARVPGGGECPAPKVWIYASKLCVKAGARLCTSDELLGGAATVLRCSGVKTTWCASRCGTGGSNYLVQYSSGAPGASLGNTSRPSAGGVANCDLSSGRHHVVCCADARRR
jgi:hypothetical protein